MNRSLWCALTLGLSLVAVDGFCPRACAVMLNHVDTFQNGTTLDWAGNSSPTNVSTGGPAGEGDAFLRINAEAFHLATFNISLQWTGDYTAQGIKAIEMDMNHLAGDPVGIRLYVFGPAGTGAFASTLSKPIATGAWNRYQFGLTADDLTDLDGDSNLATTLAAVSRILIRYDIAMTPTPVGMQTATITATLGIDNIRGIIPGDVNYNGVVDIFDVNLVSANWSGLGPTADANADGDVDIFDVNLISANWTTVAVTVPEPASLALAGIAAAGLIVLCKRRWR